MKNLWFCVPVLFFVVAGCSKDSVDQAENTTIRDSLSNAEPDASSAEHSLSDVNPAVAAAFPTDKWVGRWHGPEATFLEIKGSNGEYDIAIRDLDGVSHYRGVHRGDNEIVFTRPETGSQDSEAPAIIRATDGVGTGMKWLQDKTTCLTIRPGEGFCRD